MNTSLILLAIGGVVLTCGDILMKKWVATNTYMFYFIGLAIYLVGLNFMAQSFKFENIAVASTLLVIFNIISLAIVSWLFFKETLSPLQIVGIVMGIATVIILELA